MKDWKTDALDLIEEAAKLARTGKSSKPAEASAQVLEAMASNGLVGPDNAHHYATVMNELIASGALRLGSVAQIPLGIHLVNPA